MCRCDDDDDDGDNNGDNNDDNEDEEDGDAVTFQFATWLFMFALDICAIACRIASSNCNLVVRANRNIESVTTVELVA